MPKYLILEISTFNHTAVNPVDVVCSFFVIICYRLIGAVAAVKLAGGWIFLGLCN
jgi:hypothetical protein